MLIFLDCSNRWRESRCEIDAVLEHAGIEQPSALGPWIESRFDHPDKRLIVYGSLGPGQVNHPTVSCMNGCHWEEGTTIGCLERRGWDAALGFPGYRWSAVGSYSRAHLCTSSDLPNHWSRLDDFEGRGHRRLLAPFFAERTIHVANIYALVE